MKNVACGAHQRGGSAVPLDNPDRRSSPVLSSPTLVTKLGGGHSIAPQDIGSTVRPIECQPRLDGGAPFSCPTIVLACNIHRAQMRCWYEPALVM